ncbi:MAG: peptidylprolyl isomerase [Alteromonadaceae bacterium]|nr:peptidylprolyl isomerase [Alteromonadaceae bacterium]
MRAYLIPVFLLLSFHSFAQEFRPLNPENTLLLKTSEGDVVIELAPQFAPKHAAQIKSLVRKGAYNGKSFYRVIDGFVAQGGLGDDDTIKPPTLKMEAEFSTEELNYSLVQENDLFAPYTAFSDGFAMAMDQEKKTAWLAHCPGTVALARGNDPDSGSADFYISIGQAPRYLDRIMTIFGRVVWGMDVVQRIKRAKPEEGGMIKAVKDRTVINEALILSYVDTSPFKKLQIEKTSGKAFADKLQARRSRSHPFFFKKPPPVLDVCQVPLAVKQ